MHNFYYLFLFLFLIACQNAPTETPATETQPTTATASEWQMLFDGTSTAAWRGYNQESFPTNGWAIDEAGNLTVSKPADGNAAGDIITKEKFENFELALEYMVSDTGNSGIFYRVLEVADQPIWHHAPEYQILDNDTYLAMDPEGIITHLSGENYDLQSAPEDYTKPVGEWNQARIVVNGNHIEHWLNGKKTIEYEAESEEWNALVAKSKFKDYPNFGRTAMGHIGLQDHGRLTKFRNIKIKELPSSFTSIYNGKNLDGWEIYGTEKWYVEDELLICESGPDAQYGYLATDKMYQDFDLLLEFKQEADGNSGVFFRSSIEGTKIAGWQAEVAPPTLHTGGIYESYGRGWLIQPDPELDKALRMGEWNEMRILAKGDHVTTWVNGTQMINFRDEKIGAANGKIALQIHDGGGIKVKWRNLRVKEMQ
ncbi:MAG: DUF1080 domain-containing protein [Saprospiraceae bacterium]